MLTLSTFNRLSQAEQAELLQYEGIYCYSRQEPEFLIDLYKMEGFFVEVYSHKREPDVMLIKSYYSDEQAGMRNAEPSNVSAMKVVWRNPHPVELNQWYA